MSVNNTLYSLLNSALAEAMGENAITIKDTRTFVSAGREVLSTSTNKEMFYQKLADRVGAVLSDYKTLSANSSDLRKNELTFGMALQVISVARINRAKANNSWGAQANPFSKQYDTTDIEVRYYSKRGTFEGETKIVYDYQLETAFTNEASMLQFVQMIFTDMENGIELAKMQLDKETFCTLIAQSVHYNGTNVSHIFKVNGEDVTQTIAPKTCINLLSDYNTKFDKELTADIALTDADFCRYMSSVIDLYSKKIKTPKAIYNIAINETWTEQDKIGLKILAEVETTFNRYLQSDVFHNELTKLPAYSVVDSWQGTGEDDDFDANSTVKIKIDDGATGQEVTQTGVVAVLYDTDGVGTTYYRRRTTSMYNGASECTNYYPKCDYGAFVLPNHNAIVFVIED